jgi:hypothetical protein
MHVAISDESAESLCGSYERMGYGFAPYTHSRDADYGIALSSPEWVRTAVARRAGLQLSSHWEAEWDRRQDAVVCQRSTGT